MDEVLRTMTRERDRAVSKPRTGWQQATELEGLAK